MNKSIQSLLFILLFISTPIANAVNIGADALIKQTSEKVLSALDKDKKEYADDPAKVDQLIKDIVLPLLDFKTMSKRALGKKSWTQASDDQKSRFVEAFKGMLVRTYSKSLTEYAGQEIEFLPYKPPASGKKTTLVKTQIKPSNGPAIPIDYRLRIKNDHWLVYDIKIDGISLVTNYRSSFMSDLRKVGIDGLIDKLNKKKDKSSS